jgi:hypothetical protein
MHMIVQRMLAQEMGIYQKQASAYFHAKSGLSEIAGNVVFNGPLLSSLAVGLARLTTFVLTSIVVLCAK